MPRDLIAMKSKSPLCFSLGVDLVEVKKAKSFYESHKGNLDFFFTKREILKITESRKPYEKLALYLAAKEAVFKALKNSQVGMLSFRNIGITEKKQGGLSFKKNFQLSFSKWKKYVVVKCAGTS